MCDEKTVEYLRDLIAEKRDLEADKAAATADNGNGAGKGIVQKLLDQGRRNQPA
jgi:hypothetical protein